MSAPPKKPIVYQINTWVWLHTVATRHGTPFGLEHVPDVALDELAALRVDYVWLMGIWQRSPYSRAHALKYKHEYLYALPDLRDDDVIGSAYAIQDYRVDDRLGGRDALAQLRARLRSRGMKLMLDFVPNHVAVDHPWVNRRGFIVRGKKTDADNRPSDFFNHTFPSGRSAALAHGRDPLFPGWADTAQLNIFNPDVRNAVRRLLADIAAQCDAVRCDMAMLLLDDIFAHTWKGYVSQPPSQPYWVEMISATKADYPDFLFVAEVYWGREYELMTQGFDYCYDKVLYDRVMERDVQKLRLHLLPPSSYQNRLTRFLENHDEQRAYRMLGARRSYPAAALLFTLPGMILLHDGQLTGRTVKLPVQIRRQPDEPDRKELKQYYLRLLQEARSPIYHSGTWTLFDFYPAGVGNITHFNLLAYGWALNETDYRLIVVNLTEHRSQGWVDLRAWKWLDDKRWRLTDMTDDSLYERRGQDMLRGGLFVDLAPFEAHIFRFDAIPEVEDAVISIP